MTNVLVCIKRVPDFSGEVLLTEDAQAADARFVGYTLSNHDSCAVELAVQVASATDGAATVLSVGDSDSVEQLRSALGVGCTAAVLVEAEPVTLGPADVAREIAAVVRDHESAGTSYDLVLLGNDAADSGDFQVGIRLAHELARPVVTGMQTVRVDGDVAHLRGRGAGRAGDLRGAAPGGGDRDGGRRRAALPHDHRPDEGQEDRDRDPAGLRATRRAAAGCG